MQAGFGGTYSATTEDGPAGLTLQESGGTVTGTLKMGGESGALRGQVERARVTGTMTYGGASLPFVIRRESGTLRLSLGDQELSFKQTSAVASKPAPVTRKPAPVTRKPVPAGWKAYKNPVGLLLYYPASWQLTQLNGQLRLVPPGAQAAAGSLPSELYLVVGLPMPGISRVDDPRLLQNADTLVMTMFPYLRRSGGSEAARVGGLDGLIVTYDGPNPTTGKPSRIRSYSVIYKGFLLQLQALGDRDKVAARDTVLRQIYASFTPKASEHDPRLVGNWAGPTLSSERVKQDGAGRITSSLSSESSSTYRLLPDGTLFQRTVSRSAFSSSSSKEIPEGQRVDANLDTGAQQSAKRGRWYAGEGKLVTILDDGTGLSASYQVAGGTLVVRAADGTTQQLKRF